MRARGEAIDLRADSPDVHRACAVAPTGADKDACLSGAEAALASELADATVTRDMALVAAEHHE